MRKILIVDDNEINRLILKKILSKDYEIFEAMNGIEAMSVLSQTGDSISAVLLDLVMPEMNGLEVLEAMSKNPSLSAIPVIVTTGSTDAGVEVEALSLGAIDFISKPYNPAVIQHRLWNTINLRETSAYINTMQRDELTGLYNRATFFKKVAEMTAAHEPGYYVMACFDVANFKLINDQYGNSKGDEVLKQLARVFEESFEPDGGIACRVMGDHFAVLYPKSIMDERKLGEIHQKASVLDGAIRPLVFSIGRYIVTDLSLTSSAMYDRATIAMASIKAKFNDRIAQYDESMRESIVREQEIIDEMHSALEDGQFEIWLQPQFNHSTGAVIGSEALVRWRHPTRGLIPPNDFIPVFESNGFIYEMDKCVWEQTCKLIKKWLDNGEKPLPVSVNMSRYDLYREDFFKTITGFVEKYGIPIELLRLEVTESAFSYATDQIIVMVKKLIERGFTVEIDDFGSGYSSLNTLKDVPADILKLDMRFLANSGDSERGGNILQSIIRMAKWLGMPVIAEGVETIQQADYLGSIGCSYIQGYLYAKPMPVADYETLLQETIQEPSMRTIETVENLDNNTFWDPNSMDTLIFNSYVGGACIFEYHNGKFELLRANKKYAQELGDGVSIEGALSISLPDYMFKEDYEELMVNLQKSIDTGDEASCELRMYGLMGSDKVTYIRSTFRAIAKTGSRSLFYCTIVNVTAQRMAEEKERLASQQVSAIIGSVNGGVSAVKIADDGKVDYVFANKQYYDILGYTRQQFNHEVENAFDIVYKDDLEHTRAVVNECINSQKPTTYEYRCEKRNGDIIWLRCNASITHFEGTSGAVLLSVINDITELTQAKEKDEQLNLLTATAHILLAQSDAAVGIDKVLNRVLDFFSGKRAYLFELSDDGQFFSNTYEVCALNVESEKHRRQNMSREVYSYFWDKMERREDVNFWDLSDIPECYAADRTLLASQNIQSIIAMPLIRDGKKIGLVGVDDPTRQQSSMSHLYAIGDYLSVILTRRDMGEKIESDSKTLRDFMDDTPGGFARYQMLGDGSFIPVYINDGLCKLLDKPKDEIIQNYMNDPSWGIHPDDREQASKAISKMLKTGEALSVRCRMTKGHDGDYIELTIFGRISKSDTGETFFNVYFTDRAMYERKNKADSFREMLPMALDAVMESTQEISFIKGNDYKYICVSKAFAMLAGKDNADEVRGKTDYDVLAKNIADKYRAEDRKLIEEGQPRVDTVEKMQSEGGLDRYTSTTKYLLRGPNGEALGIFGISRDITHNREAYAQLQLLTNSIPGGIAMYEIFSDKTRMLYFSDGFYSISGYTKEEYQQMTEKDPLFLVLPQDVKSIKDSIDKVLAGDDTFEYYFRSRNKDGTYRWLSLRGSVLERHSDRVVVNAVKLDVTHRMQIEETLRIREKEYQLAIAHGGRMIYRYSFADNSIELPEETAKLLGAPTKLKNVPDSIIESGVVAERSIDEYYRFFAEIKRGEKTGSMTVRRKIFDGSYTWFSAQFSTVYDDEGKPASALVIVEDVTEELRKDEETAELIRNEEIMRLAAEHSNRLIYIYDVATRSAHSNADTAEEKNLVLYVKDLPESMIENGMVMAESAEDFRQMHNDIASGKPTGSFKIRIVGLDGNARWFEAKYSLTYSGTNQSKTAVISYLDVTESHEKELAYERYIQTINESDASEGVMLYLEADVTTDVTEKQGGIVPKADLPPVGSSRLKTIEYITQNYVAKQEQSACLEFFSRQHLITAFSDGIYSLEADWSVKFSDDSLGFCRTELQMVQDPYSGHIKVYTILRDITAEKKEELEIKRLAEMDGMTGIFNKMKIEKAIRSRLSEDEGVPCALLIADLDNLKSINDSLGHDAGDKAIKLLAKQLSTQFRKSDLVGRAGGDEFIAFLTGVDKERLSRIITAFMRRLSTQYFEQEGEVSISGSIGIAMGETGKDSYESLFKMADTALYHVKRNGKNDFAFYTRHMEMPAYQYKGHSELSIWQTRSFDDAELDNLLMAVSQVYPTVISANLTQNSYHMMRYDDYDTHVTDLTGAFNDLAESVKETFSPEDWESFIKAFMRENLVAAYNRGETVVTHNGKRLGDGGIYHKVRTDAVFVKNESNDDVLVVILARTLD